MPSNNYNVLHGEGGFRKKPNSDCVILEEPLTGKKKQSIECTNKNRAFVDTEYLDVSRNSTKTQIKKFK